MNAAQLAALDSMMEEGEAKLQTIELQTKLWNDYVANPAGEERDEIDVLDARIKHVTGPHARLQEWFETDEEPVEDGSGNTVEEISWGQFVGKAMTHGDEALTAKMMDLNDRVTKKLKDVKDEYADLFKT
jgi:hypothetical protein